MSENGDLIKRIDSLEMHIAHQEKIIEELNDVSIKQWAEIQKLSYQFGHLRNKFSELEGDIKTLPEEKEAPPHY